MEEREGTRNPQEVNPENPIACTCYTIHKSGQLNPKPHSLRRKLSEQLTLTRFLRLSVCSRTEESLVDLWPQSVRETRPSRKHMKLWPPTAGKTWDSNASNRSTHKVPGACDVEWTSHSSSPMWSHCTPFVLTTHNVETYARDYFRAYGHRSMSSMDMDLTEASDRGYGTSRSFR